MGEASILFVYTPTAQRQPIYKQFRGEPRTPRLTKERYIIKDNKNKLVALRFRESDYDKIKVKAEKANMNFTEFVTNSALNKKIIKIDGLPDVLKEIKAIGKNLNQLTTLCNMGKVICPDLVEIKADFAKSVIALEEIARRCS